jgi:hemerythrin
MGRFQLTGALVTGNQDIDEQHRTLIELGNRVVAPTAIDNDPALFQEALGFLAAYVDYHFASEEHVMRESGYPHYQQHLAWHHRFRQEVAEFVRQEHAHGDSKPLRLKVSFAIEDWLLAHIQIMDAALAKFLRQQRGGTVIKFPDVRTLQEAGAITHDFNEACLRASCVGTLVHGLRP